MLPGESKETKRRLNEYQGNNAGKYRVSQKKFTRLSDSGIRNIQPMFGSYEYATKRVFGYSTLLFILVTNFFLFIRVLH